MDTPAEPCFDRITRIASTLFDVPIALVSLIDGDRQWFKSRQGLGLTETPRSISFCGHAILHDTIFIVQDTLNDERFSDNPLVTGQPHIRFYAGVPLSLSDGYHVGTLCIIDHKPRTLTNEQIRQLLDLAQTVEDELSRKQLNDIATLYHAEKKRLQAVLDTVMDGIIAFDGTGMILLANPAAIRLFGYAPTDMLGHDVSMLIADSSIHDFNLYLRTIQMPATPKNGKSGCEIHGQRNNGSIFSTYLAVTEMRSGTHSQFVGLVRNITLDKQNELALINEKNQFRALFDAISDAVFFIDINTIKFAQVNRAACEHYGYTEEEFLTMGPQHISAPEFIKYIAERVKSVREYGNLVFETAHIKKDGTIIPVEINARLVYFSGKAINVAVVRNISERKKGEQILKESHDKNWALISAIPDLILTIRQNGEILACHASDPSLLDTMPEIFLHQRVEDIFPRSVATLLANAFTSALHSGAMQEMHYPLTMRDGQERHFEARVARSTEDTVICIIRDITEREVDRQKRESHASELSDRLEFSELDIAAKRMEVTYLSRLAMLGELSGALAHELNQPLTSILSNAEAAQLYLAQNGGGEQIISDILQDIVDEDNRAGEIIRHLRQLFGKREMVSQRVDINTLVTDVFRILRNDMINRNVTLQTDLAVGLPAINVDRVQIEQVIINLIINACDAMESLETMQRHIIVRTAFIENKTLQISVIDHGPGIATDVLEKIFDPFYTTKERGMGLGLSLCRNIADSNGGRLWTENNPEHGASFHVSFPVLITETI